MAFGRRLSVLLALLQACASNEFMTEEYERELTSAESFDASKVIQTEVVELKAVPLALPEIILARAEEVVNQGVKLDSRPLHLTDVRKYALENNLGI